MNEPRLAITAKHPRILQSYPRLTHEVLMKKTFLPTILVITVFAMLAVAGYYASTLYNLRPVDKVLDPDIIAMQDAWATRTAPGQPALKPGTYTERVRLHVLSENTRQLRKLEAWLPQQGYPIDHTEYYDEEHYVSSGQQHLDVRIPENELFPIAQQIARWPTVHKIYLYTARPYNSISSNKCMGPLVRRIRDDPIINTPEDAQHILDYIAAETEACAPPWSTPAISPTVKPCQVDNPILNIHRRHFYQRLLESYNGTDPIVRDDSGSILIPMHGVFPTDCAMYNAQEKEWFPVNPSYIIPP